MKYEKSAYRIREAMNDLGISQQELADKSHIGKSSISHYVNGTNEPGNKSAYLLAKVLGVNPAWLMGLDAPKYYKPSDPTSEKTEEQKAMELYEKYKNSIPEIQAAVESLLKTKPDS